jgi:quinol---cytochrome c reductase iron-sulfur subunit, bacillus type
MNETKNIDSSPDSANPQNSEEACRRVFLERLSIILGTMGALSLAAPAVGFIFAPLSERAPHLWRKVGKVSGFKVGTTVPVRFEDATPLRWAGVTANSAAWLRRVDEEHFIAFAINCSHLGCPVRWLPNADLFLCPCHGGVYYSDGTVAAGPPPRPLTRYPVRVNNGEVEIQTRPLPFAA